MIAQSMIILTINIYYTYKFYSINGTTIGFQKYLTFQILVYNIS